MDGLLKSLTLLQVSSTTGSAAAGVPTEVAATPAAGAAPVESGWIIFLIALAVFTLPFVLGTLTANLLRLRDLAFRIGLVYFVTALALTPFIYHGTLQAMGVKGARWDRAISWGIDLAGGTNLVYQIDTSELQKEKKTLDPGMIQRLTDSIKKRLDPSNVEEITVRRVGQDRIEIIIPGADQDVVEQKKRTITRLGSLEFAILANEKDHAGEIARARLLPPEKDELRNEKGLRASWVSVAPGKSESADGGAATRVVKRFNDQGVEVDTTQFLVIHDDPSRAVTGRFLDSARAEIDQKSSMPAVGFRMTAAGSNRFLNLTTKYQPDKTDGFHRRLAILLDNKIHSAPNLNEPLSGGGQITGNFTRQEVDELVNVLNAGSLEVPLIQKPISEFTISPLLGYDVQQKGILAILLSAAAVFIFITVYYRAAGLVADLCLILNLILVIGAMAFIDATFTLPGLAGLVLTIGMAVDSNVLIYERMREELQRGASLRLAIENGFEKAFAAIIDSNITTLITAVILYLIGSDTIKGFAVSLFIGLVCSLFSVLFFGHLVFQILERKRWVRTLSFLQFFPTPNINFLAKRVPAFLFSVVLIGAGLATLFVRGRDNFDIDFTGGTMVTFEFTKPQETREVRALLDDKFPGAISLEELSVGTDTTNANGTRYRMRTTEQNRDEVRRLINESFADPAHELTRVTLKSDPVAPVAAADVAAFKAPPSANLDRFTGGNQARLHFSGPIAEATVSTYIAEELEKIGKANSNSRYDSAGNLIVTRGVSEAAAAEPAVGGTKVQQSKFTELVAMTTSDVDAADLSAALKAIETKFATEPVFDEFTSFDTSVAFDTQVNAIWAMVLSLIAIVVYIWFRFEKLYFGFAAVAALTHDALVVLGSVAVGAYLSYTPVGQILGLEDFKINMGFVAAILTIIGYSLNDTIVIFDRIREIKGRNPNITYDMINLSVNQTLSRTILTALTVFLVVVVLYAFGGEGIHTFAYSFIIGTITGSYSTVFIANPILYWLLKRETPVANRVAA